MSNLPLLGGEILDLKARATNRQLRDYCAKVTTQRDLYKERAEAQHKALADCLVLLCECRDNLQRASGLGMEMHDGPELIKRITDLIGDGDG